MLMTLEKKLSEIHSLITEGMRKDEYSYLNVAIKEYESLLDHPDVGEYLYTVYKDLGALYDEVQDDLEKPIEYLTKAYNLVKPEESGIFDHYTGANLWEMHLEGAENSDDLEIKKHHIQMAEKYKSDLIKYTGFDPTKYDDCDAFLKEVDEYQAATLHALKKGEAMDLNVDYTIEELDDMLDELGDDSINQIPYNLLN